MHMQEWHCPKQRPGAAAGHRPALLRAVLAILDVDGRASPRQHPFNLTGGKGAQILREVGKALSTDKSSGGRTLAQVAGFVLGAAAGGDMMAKRILLLLCLAGTLQASLAGNSTLCSDSDGAPGDDGRCQSAGLVACLSGMQTDRRITQEATTGAAVAA